MTTGPQHFAEAERLLDTAAVVNAGGQVLTVQAEVSLLLIRAQVHATLAHAAATALSDFVAGEGEHGMSLEDYIAWEKVASIHCDGE